MPGIESPRKEFSPRNSNDVDRTFDDRTATNNIDSLDETATETVAGNKVLVLITIESHLAQIGNDCNLSQSGSRTKRKELRQVENDQLQFSDTDQDCVAPINEETKKRVRRHKKRSVKPDGKQLTYIIGPAEPSSTDKAFIFMSDEIMMAVQVYRDNGEWEMFAKMTKQMSDKYSDNMEALMVIQLEQCMALCYQNKLKESEQKILKTERTIADMNLGNAAELTSKYYSIFICFVFFNVLFLVTVDCKFISIFYVQYSRPKFRSTMLIIISFCFISLSVPFVLFYLVYFGISYF